MDGPAGIFTGLSGLYLLGLAYTLYLLWKNRAVLGAPKLSGQTRQLAALTALFVLVPVGVLLHEGGHMVAAWSTGSRVLGLHYFLFWGYVEYIPASASPLLEWYVALAGNFVSFALGVGCLAAAMSRIRMRPFVRVALLQLGILELVQTLIFYPLLSLDPQFAGDWDTIYSFGAPVASGVTLALHLAALLAFVRLLQANRQVRFLLGTG